MFIKRVQIFFILLAIVSPLRSFGYCTIAEPADEKIVKAGMIDHVKMEVSNPLYGKLGKINVGSIRVEKLQKYSFFQTDKWPGWKPTDKCDGGNPSAYGVEIEISYKDLKGGDCHATVAVFMHYPGPEAGKFTWYAATDYLVKKPVCKEKEVKK